MDSETQEAIQKALEEGRLAELRERLDWEDNQKENNNGRGSYQECVGRTGNEVCGASRLFLCKVWLQERRLNSSAFIEYLRAKAFELEEN